MTELKNIYNSFYGNCFKITTEEGSFKIYCDSNDIVGFTPCFEQDDVVNKSFEYTIKKDDRYIYSLFDELYDAIVSKRPFKYIKDKENIVFYELEELVKDGTIEWHSDGFNYDAASTLKIAKDDDANYVLTINKSKVVSDDISSFYTYTVQIDGVDSRYAPYNETFVDMYNKLKDHDLFYNRVLYNNGVVNKKKVRQR